MSGRAAAFMIRHIGFLVALLPFASLAGTPGCIGFTLDAPLSQTYRTFTDYPPATAILAGRMLTAGDIDGDGFEDVVAAGSNGIDVLYGDGTGRFIDQAHVTDNPVEDVAIGDFDRDGLLDIVAVSLSLPGNSFGFVELDRNHGGRAFAAPERLSGTAASVVVAGDFKGHRQLDLLLLGNDTRLLVNDGSGHFSEKILAIPGNPHDAAAGDFDGDGKLDFVIVGASGADPFLSIARNAGDGSFSVTDSRRSNFPALAVGDLNGDGRDDIIALSPLGNALYVFTHGLSGESMIQFDGPPIAVVARDFNGDGHVDLAVLLSGAASELRVTPSLRILLNDGEGHLSTAIDVPVSSHASGIAAADFDGDGTIDIAVNTNDFLTLSVNVLHGNGNGTFRTFQRLAFGLAQQIVVAGDVDSNGSDELVTSRITTADPTTGWAAEISIGRSSGSSFTREHVADVPIYPQALTTGDIDGDYRREIAVAGFDGVIILQRNADGSWKEQSRYNTAGWADDAAFIDTDGDHRDELAFVASSGTNAPQLMVVSPARAGLTLFSASMHPAPRRVVASDVNGDGIPDLIVTSWGSGSPISQLPPPSDGYLSLFIGHGDGTFGPEARLVDGQNFGAAFAGDFDGDGKADIVVRRFLANETLILRGDGRGHFDAALTIASLSGPSWSLPVTDMQAYDVDGDGALDLVAATDTTLKVVRFARGGVDRQTEYAGTAGSVVVIRTSREAVPSVIVNEYDSGTLALFRGTCSRSRAVRSRR